MIGHQFSKHWQRATFRCIVVVIIAQCSASAAEEPLHTNVHLRNYCGPNCLTTFLRMNGSTATLEQIASLSEMGSKGASLLGLRKAAVANGLYAQGAQVTSVTGLRRLNNPAIVLIRTKPERDADHFILVTGFSGDQVKVIDPPRKPYLLAAEKLETMLDGRVLLLSTQPIVLDTGRTRFYFAAGLGIIAMLIASITVWRSLNRRALASSGYPIDAVVSAALKE